MQPQQVVAALERIPSVAVEVEAGAARDQDALPAPPPVGGHADINPTLADLLGVPPAPSWRGRSLFDRRRTGRAYFYAANDDYLLGAREGKWKYVYNGTRGSEQLFDMAKDPDELTNPANGHRELCQRLRQRLAAWRDDTGEHLARIRAARAAAAHEGS